MQIGAQYQGDVRGPKEFARRAEAVGFDSLWCGDHVEHLVDGLATLGCFAGATERITIGLNLLVVPFRPAAVIAKALTTIANCAPGRVISAFGVGGEFPAEFAATGAQRSERGAYTDDALDIVRGLWRGEPLTHHSRWADFDAFEQVPAPRVVPEVWIGGRSDAALRRAVRVGEGYVPYLVSPEQFARRRERLSGFAAEAGRSLDGFRWAALCTMIPGPSVDAAAEVALGSLRLSGLSPESVRAMYLLGDDESILARLAEYAAAGVQHLILGCIPGTDEQLEDFFATSARILDAARALGPGATG